MHKGIESMKKHHRLKVYSQLLYDIHNILLLSLDKASTGCKYVGIHGTTAWLSKLQTEQAILTYAMQHLITDR